MILIASYPRSGNHLIRFCVEYVTGKPTLGCYDNPDDIPIHLNGFVDAPGVLSHVGGEPIAHKLHFVSELEHLREIYQIDRIIFIKRNTLEAILAHTITPKNLQQLWHLNRQIREHTELERRYTDSNLPKICVNYENIVTEDSDLYQAELDKLIQFLGPQVISQYSDKLRTDFDALRQISANPSKRAWGGIRSQGSDYWRKNAFGPRVALIKSLIWLNNYRSMLPGGK